MSVYGIVSKAALFLVTFATMRYIGLRRRRAEMMPALTAVSGGDLGRER
jgi:hypothetical protein